MSKSFYVSERKGNDKGTGEFDDAFKTIEKAIRESRRSKRNGAKDVTIYLRGGMYIVNKSIEIFKKVSMWKCL